MAALRAARYVWDEGISTVIGIDPLYSNLNGAINQRNVFSPNCAVASVYINNAQKTVVAGNWFGYDSVGNVSMIPTSFLGGSAIQVVGNSSAVVIGNNADNIGDDKESNWFGCLYRKDNSGATIRVIAPAQSTVSGNYFGWSTAGAPNAAVTTLLFKECQVATYISSSGNTVIGK